MEIKDYPSNSYSKKPAMDAQVKTDQVERAKPVTSNATSVKKKSGLKKFTEAFFQEDLKTIANYIRNDVLIPAAKGLILNTVNAILYPNGGAPGYSSSPLNRVNHIAYNKMSQQRANYIDSNSSMDFGDVIFQTRQDAENVRMALCERCDEYGRASWMDLYDLAGVRDIPFTADRYGWRDLRMSRVETAGGGYIIRLPKAIQL